MQWHSATGTGSIHNTDSVQNFDSGQLLSHLWQLILCHKNHIQWLQNRPTIPSLLAAMLAEDLPHQSGL